MPTKLYQSRSVKEDLRALEIFIDQEQHNWKAVRENLRLLRHQYDLYASEFFRCGRYRTLKPQRYDTYAGVLHHLYDHRPACLAYVGDLRRRASRELSVCPYCGLPAGKITLDHYLPRDQKAFPHLSILSLNLVPACTSCQLAKSNWTPAFRQPSARPGRAWCTRSRPVDKRIPSVRSRSARLPLAYRRRPKRLLHPYFDQFLAGIVWKLEPQDERKPLDSLTLVPAVRSSWQDSLVSYHIRCLGLQQRFDVEIRHWGRFAVEMFQRAKVSTKKQALAIVQIQLDSHLKKERTPNGVASTFFRALRDYPAVLDALLNRATRAPPVRILRSQGIHL